HMKKFRLEFFFRSSLFVVCALFCWAFIADAQTTNSVAPIVIKSPENHAKYRERKGTELQVEFAIEIAAGETNYNKVQFFDRDKPLALVSNSPGIFVWDDPPRGDHSIVAKLIYPNHQTKSSAPVKIHVNNAALTFGLDQVEFLTSTPLGIPLW